jgi:hypothetical protein
VDLEYTGNRDKWMTYLSEQHKAAAAAAEASKTSSDTTSSIQNELLDNMGKTTANQTYYDDSHEDCEEDECSSSPATQQGSELCNAKQGMRAPCVDMNQYVRKDSIPCWSCNLDY